MPKPIEQIYDDPRFVGLPRGRQAELLVKLTGRERAAVDAELEGRFGVAVPRPKPERFGGVLPNLEAGLAGAARNTAQRSENLGYQAGRALDALGVDWGPDRLNQLFGQGGILGLLGRGAGSLASTEDVKALEASAAKGDTTVPGRVAQVVGSLPVALPEAAAAVSAGGPIGGFAALSAADAARPGASAEDIAKATAAGGLIGSAFKYSAPFNVGVRAGSVGGMTALAEELLGEGADPVSAGANAIFAALGGRARARARGPEVEVAPPAAAPAPVAPMVDSRFAPRPMGEPLRMDMSPEAAAARGLEASAPRERLSPEREPAQVGDSAPPPEIIAASRTSPQEAPPPEVAPELRAAEPPPSKLKLNRESDFDFPITNQAGEVVGNIFGEARNHNGRDVLRVRNAGIDRAEALGQGNAVRAYEELAREARAQGRDLISDSEVTPEAIRVYEALARRGYTVERHPEAVVEASGKLSVPGKANAPVFRVTGGPRAPELAKMETRVPESEAGTGAAYYDERIKAAGTTWRPGPDYVPTLNFPPDIRPVPKKLQRQGTAIYDLYKAMGVPIQEGSRMRIGKYKHVDALGFYVKNPTPGQTGHPGGGGLVRTKQWGASEVAGHEMVHRLVDTIPAFKRIFERSANELANMGAQERAALVEIQNELRRISYDHGGRNPKSIHFEEGLAELGRLWLTQKRELTEPRGPLRDIPPRAPRATAAFEAAINALPRKQRDAWYRAQRDMTAFFEQGFLASFRSKTMPEPRLGSELTQARGDQIREGLTDRLHGLLRAERKLTGGDLEGGAYRSARNLAGVPWIARGMVERGAPRWDVVNGKPAIRFRENALAKTLGRKGVGDTEATLRESFDYFTAVQARELFHQKADPGKANSPSREQLFTNQEIMGVIAQYETPARKAAFEELKAFQKDVLEFAIEGGLISREKAAAFRRTEYAFSFARDLSGGEARGGRPADPLGSGDGIFKLRGSSRNLKDPMQNLLEGPARLIQLTLENRVRQKVASYSTRPDGGMFVVPLKPSSKVVRLHTETVAARLNRVARKYGLEDVVDVNMFPEVLEFWAGPKPPTGRNVMTVLYNGKPRYFELVDPQLARAVENLRPQRVESLVLDLANKFRTFRQSTITMDPSFIASNAVRDSIMGWITSRTSGKPLQLATSGMCSILAKDQAYWDYFANGGGGATARDNVRLLSEKAKRFAASKGFDPKRIVTAPVEAFRVLENVGQASELATRLGEFKRAQAQGKGLEDAAYLGREISTDFSMRGASPTVNALTQSIMFLSAMINSGDRLYRAVRHEKGYRASTMGKMAAVALFSGALYLANRENPEYQDLPDWDKSAYWHFYTPAGHYKVPKIWEVGSLGTIVERMLAAGLDDEEDGPMWQAIGREIFKSFDVGLPVGIDMVAEQVFNRVWFTGQPIEPEYLARNTQPADRFTASTPEALRAFGKAQRGNPVQVSPARAEAALRGLLGQWAMYGLGITDWALYDANKFEFDQYIDEYPVVRRFYERPGKYSRYTGEFYDQKQAIDELYGSYVKAAQDGDQAAIESYDPRDIGLAGAFDQASRNLRGINQAIAEVRNDRTISDVEKRDQVEELRKQQISLQKALVELRRAIRGQQ